ncbi:MAG: hypothetical protein ACREB5_10345 [Sphingomonadaceae bacterium]
MSGGHLAGTEALDVELGHDLDDPRLEPLVQVRDRDGHAIDAAQAFARLFNNLHRHSRIPECGAGSRRQVRPRGEKVVAAE